MRIGNLPPVHTLQHKQTPPLKPPADPGDVPLAKDIPLMPISFTAVGAIAGAAIAGTGAVGAGLAAGAAIGAGLGIVAHNIARWCTPEGPRLIVGHTGDHEARLWGRGDSKRPVMFLEVHGEDGKTVYAGHKQLSKEDGYTGTLQVDGLQPGTRYTCKVSYGKTAQTPPEERKRQETGEFRTTSPDDKETSFLLGSCNNHRFWRRGESWERIARLAEEKNPDFVLQTGDQIYADQPLQSYQVDGVRGCYRRAWSSEGARDVLKSRANYMILDDHEIGNGFGEKKPLGKFRRNWLLARGLLGSDPSQRKTLETSGLKAYADYQHSHNPQTFGADKLYYTFSRGQNEFFVMDARSERDRSKGEIITAEQMSQLKHWLTENRDKPKFVVSSVPFLAEETDRGEDSIWTSKAYKAQRDEILDFIAEHELRGVVFLTGDSHTSFHMESELQRPGKAPVEVHELSASPINGFWLHGSDQWEKDKEATTASGTHYKNDFDEDAFLGTDTMFSRDASGLMSVETDGDTVKFEIHRTHLDDGGPFRSGSFKLGLQ